jgi:type I restriction enzyme S subunit
MSSDFSILSDNDDLPIGWVITELENVCTVQGGYAFKSKDYTENGIPLVRISNLVENNNVDLDSNPIFLPESYRISHSNYCLREGDILIAMSGATTGKMAVFRCSLDALLNQRVGRFIIRDKTLVDKPYLSKLIENLSSKVAQKAYGGAQPNISPSEIERLLIPLPPLNEQRRIVEKVEALMARSRRAKEALDAIPKLIEQFRQSVLAAAFRGDLTADWREQNPNIEPASVLLERIRKERREKWEQTELEKMRAKGKEPLSDEWKKKYKEPEAIDDSDLPEIPEGWCWLSVDACTSMLTDGEHSTPERSDQGVYLLSARNVLNGELSLEKVDYIPEHIHQQLEKRLKVQSGDVLLSCSGSVGRSCIVPENLKFSLVRSVAVLRTLLDMGEYISLAIRSPFLQSQIEEQKTQTAQANIFQGRIKVLALPIAPFDEQKLIIRRINEALQSIRFLEEQFIDLKSAFQSLDQSILSKSFRGELVEQDPNDEPASVLLERIQKEREKEKAKVKQTGAKKLKK